MQKAIRIVVTGKVQGVFFRVSTQEIARKLGLSGWCMNLPNGDVQIHAEGEGKDLYALTEWCKLGSPMSKVESVKSEDSKPEGYTEFNIKRS